MSILKLQQISAQAIFMILAISLMQLVLTGNAEALSHEKIAYPESIRTVTRSMDSSAKQIVGSYFNGIAWHGFLRSDGVMHEIRYPRATSTFVTGVNQAGVLVGFYRSQGTFHGFLRQGGKMSTFDVPQAFATFVEGINDQGKIVGSYTLTENGKRLAFAYDGEEFANVQPPAALSAEAKGISYDGTVVGSFTDAKGTHGFVCKNGIYTVVDVIGSSLTSLNGINRRGTAVGYSDIHGKRHGVIYHDGNATTFSIIGSVATTACGIGDDNRLTGTSGSGYGTSSYVCQQSEIVRQGIARNLEPVKVDPKQKSTPWEMAAAGVILFIVAMLRQQLSEKEG